MSNLRSQLQRLELDHHPAMPDLSRMSLEELEKLAVDNTRKSLPSRLGREPTESEIAQQRDEDRACFASLSLEESVDLKKKFAC